MPALDPRERYDDLRVSRSRETLPPDEFAAAADSEAAAVGWLAFAHVLEPDGRVLLVRQPWADGWLEPGGARQPGESLADTVAREVREETGVECTPVRPHAVDEFTFEDERTGETDGWTSVFFEARAETTAVADDLGLANEEITDARWFDGLPDDLFHPALTGDVYRRCVENGRS